MSEENKLIKSESEGTFKMLRAMVGIGIICAFLIVMTFEGTKPRIAKNKAEALEKAIFKVVPGMVEKENFIWSEAQGIMNEGETQEGELIYAGYDQDGNLKGLVIEASGQGFADILKILYGYDPNTEKIIGFYVLESKETPGLGDKIEKDENFLSNFKALDVSLDADGTLKNKIETVKNGKKTAPWQIDGITGATISSRAIGDIINVSTSEWIPRLKENVNSFKK